MAAKTQDAKELVQAIVTAKPQMAIPESVKALSTAAGVDAALDTMVKRIHSSDKADAEVGESTRTIVIGLYTKTLTPERLLAGLRKLSDDDVKAADAGYKTSDFKAAVARIKQGMLYYARKVQEQALEVAQDKVAEIPGAPKLTDAQKDQIRRNAIVPRTINYTRPKGAGKDAPKTLLLQIPEPRKVTRKAGGQTNQVVVQTSDGKATVPTGAQALADMESALAKAPKDILGEIQQRVYSEIRGIAAGLLDADLKAFLKNVRDCCDKLDPTLEDKSGKNQVVSQESGDQPAELDEAA